MNSDSLALLQYTSGSTGKPKGGMVSHNNLLSHFGVMKAKADELWHRLQAIASLSPLEIAMKYLCDAR